MKHAFLIIAHTEPKLFMTLISMLDHQDCDIYIHVDRKADIRLFKHTTARYSELYFLDDRIDVRWGHYSQIQTELKLFEAAHKKGIYSYYHLMSGIDMPIKPIEQILKWFEENNGYEYLGGKPAGRKYHKRMHRRYFFISRKRNYATTLILAFQKMLGIKWNRKTEVWMGHNWGSFTHGFITELLKHTDWIESHFKYSFCGDELYKPTLMRHLGIEERDHGSLRHIDWKRGNPYTFGNDDFDELMNSEKLFARKFSSNQMEVIYRLHKTKVDTWLE